MMSICMSLLINCIINRSSCSQTLHFDEGTLIFLDWRKSLTLACAVTITLHTLWRFHITFIRSHPGTCSESPSEADVGKLQSSATRLSLVNKGWISCRTNGMKWISVRGARGCVLWHLLVITHVNLSERHPVFPERKQMVDALTWLSLSEWHSWFAHRTDSVWLISSESDRQKWQSTGVEDW